jgi:predicted N-acetyltransferase YhbS
MKSYFCEFRPKPTGAPMSDLLVKLYELPSAEIEIQRLATQGITIRAALPHERSKVTSWIASRFDLGWADECAAAFSRQPVSCLLAIENGIILGFACHDVTARGFFGPYGVEESRRQEGIGKALMFASLHALRAMGHAYAIIGWAGPVEHYRDAVGAIEIPDSSPGIYRDPLA